MPSCYLQVYEKLTSVHKDYDYWREYTSFYESYWGGPTSPYGIWFGNEYETFENNLADHLQIDKKDLKQCLFIKENDNYYICPSELNENKQNYSYLVDNIIPLHWFLLFNENQKKVFKTHWGFGAIHYSSSISKCLNEISGINKIQNHNLDVDTNFKINFGKLILDLLETNKWLKTFNSDGILILNYGDLLANFPQNSLDKEDSVKIMNDIINLVNKNSFTDAERIFNFLIERWSKIEFSNQRNESNLNN